MTLKSRIDKKIHVADRTLGMGEPVFITAEIGAAHGGSIENAKILIRSAAEAGCDGADIFMADPEAFYYTNPREADYIAAWKELEFSVAEWKELLRFGEENNIVVYPTPLDSVSIRRCAEIGVKMININSDDVNNIMLLEDAAELGVPISMHDIDQSLAEVEAAVKVLWNKGARDIIALHSTLETGDSEFGYETANLNVMKTYSQAFGDLGVLAGCVEHTTSDFLIFGVAALQPALISKHIKIDENVKADKKISVNIDDLKMMVKRVRFIEMALGNGQNQKLVKADGSAPQRFRNKVLVAAADIPVGKIIERKDIAAKRPGVFGGLHPWHSKTIIGARAKTAIKSNTLLNLNQFEEFPEPDYKFPEMHDYRVKDFSKVVAV
ncbi:MAG: N-acetylneuraminate synthase family protein [Victivallales bacterium]|nr:N-acetylneuraminate synthase family protein [Victivallales bacterium]